MMRGESDQLRTFGGRGNAMYCKVTRHPGRLEILKDVRL